MPHEVLRWVLSRAEEGLVLSGRRGGVGERGAVVINGAGVGVRCWRRGFCASTTVAAASPAKRAAIFKETKAAAKKKGNFKPLEYSPPTRKPPPLLNMQPRSPPQANPLRYRKLPLILGGITVLIFSGYSFYLYASLQRAMVDGATLAVPADVSGRYDAIASTFDSSVDTTERLIGLTRLRRKMVGEASGDVCEVSIGTGRNLAFYDWDFKGFNGVGKVGKGNEIKRGKVRSFTAVDKSQEMLEMAHDKFSAEYPGVLGVRWVIQDAADPLPAPPVPANERSGNRTGKKFDTIVQTMGLCSTNDPVRLLKNLGESVEEDGGRILLLEHGRGTWSWLNKVLDGLAPRHALEFGCVWNKDIGQIVEESGLKVVKMERKHFGTTWWIELQHRPRSSVEVSDKTLANEKG